MPEDANGTTKKAVSKTRARAAKPDPVAEVLSAIAEMTEPDRVIAERIHALVAAEAPELTPRLWYGMPAYAKDGKVVCFFQSGQKFKTRYSTFGFQQDALLDDGNMWPVAFAVTTLTAAEEARIVSLLKQAVS